MAANGAPTAVADEEEDDYMNMALPDPTPTLPISSLARKQARAREAAARAHPKSKRELEAAATAARDAALSTALDPSNRGARMMAKLGFKGGALGRKREGEDDHANGNGNADGNADGVKRGQDARRTEPILVDVKEGRGGIGMESEAKKRVRERMAREEGAHKKRKADEGEFVDRVRREREEKRVEGSVWGAMKVAEGLDEEDDTSGAAARTDVRSVNVLWRALVGQRVEQEREKRIRKEYNERFARHLPEVADREEDVDDKLAMGTEVEDYDDELDEDKELEQHNALPPEERLEKLVQYLRDTYNYCFWCKYRYPDKEMDGCPGKTEEDHD